MAQSTGHDSAGGRVGVRRAPGFGGVASERERGSRAAGRRRVRPRPAQSRPARRGQHRQNDVAVERSTPRPPRSRGRGLDVRPPSVRASRGRREAQAFGEPRQAIDLRRTAGAGGLWRGSSAAQPLAAGAATPGRCRATTAAGAAEDRQVPGVPGRRRRDRPECLVDLTSRSRPSRSCPPCGNVLQPCMPIEPGVAAQRVETPRFTSGIFVRHRRRRQTLNSTSSRPPAR